MGPWSNALLHAAVCAVVPRWSWLTPRQDPLIPVKGGRHASRDTRFMPSFALRGLPIVLAALLAGCASGRLLPDASVAARAEFADFEAARLAFEKIEPYKSTVGDLKALGFDTAATNVRLIGYPDVVGRLAPNSALSLDQLDPGIRECVLARLECRAYEYHLANETRERTGGFVLDWLNFKRTTHVDGWQFDAIVAVRNDGVVLFRNFGGAPHNERTEQQINPLGPFQGVGDSVSGQLLK